MSHVLRASAHPGFCVIENKKPASSQRRQVIPVIPLHFAVSSQNRPHQVCQYTLIRYNRRNLSQPCPMGSVRRSGAIFRLSLYIPLTIRNLSVIQNPGILSPSLHLLVFILKPNCSYPNISEDFCQAGSKDCITTKSCRRSPPVCSNTIRFCGIRKIHLYLSDKLICFLIIVIINTIHLFQQLFSVQTAAGTKRLQRFIVVTQLCIDIAQQYHGILWYHISPLFRKIIRYSTLMVSAVSLPSFRSITIVSSARTLPESISLAASVSTFFWRKRFSGLAP